METISHYTYFLIFTAASFSSLVLCWMAVYLAIWGRICMLWTLHLLQVWCKSSCGKVWVADSTRPLDSGCEYLSKAACFVSSVWQGLPVSWRSQQLIITIFRAIFGEKTDNHLNLNIFITLGSFFKVLLHLLSRGWPPKETELGTASISVLISQIRRKEVKSHGKAGGDWG